MGKGAPQTQPQPTPQQSAPAPTPPAPPPPVEPVKPEPVTVTPKGAVGATSQGGYSGTGKGKSRTVLTGPAGALGATPIRRPLLTGSMGSGTKTTLGG
tara:strand:- start:507 stop:800 length:294 start_codon:yes stop_codon:yes gene_type:complete